jgi:hypothetical protein
MTTRIANLELAQAVLASAAANVAKALDEAGGGLQDKLALAVAAEHELATAAQAIEASLSAAISVAASRAARLRVEIREAALVEVTALLRNGTLTMADLAARSGVAIEGNMTFERVAGATPAPAKALAPVVAAPDATLSAEVRENLRLQAGYMHPVKFRDPVTGAGWSGRGPTPKWLKALCVGGKTVEDFRVGAAGPAAASNAPTLPTGAETSAAEVATVENSAAPVAQVEPQAPAVDAEAAAPATANAVAGDEVVSFDASGLDDDLNAPARGEGDDDIGEFVTDISAMNLDNPAGNAAQFLAVA